MNQPVVALLYGLKKITKRAKLNVCNYDIMRQKLIIPNAVNIAGFANFLWQDAFVKELEAKAKKLNIKLNINIFPKHKKKQFQNYLAICESANDLPEILIGKGFSSLMTQRFVEKFVKSGDYCRPMPHTEMGAVFSDAGLKDPGNNFHPFGVEEMVMVYDKSLPTSGQIPSSWDEILSSKYAGTITQMGKNQRDHFGFVMMLYLFTKHGEKGIEHYAGNVKDKQHFSYIIKHIGKNDY